MFFEVKNLDYENLKKYGTGTIEKSETYKSIIYPIGQYRVKVILTPNNEFVGIEEITIDKDFLNFEQRMKGFGDHDLEESYQTE